MPPKIPVPGDYEISLERGFLPQLLPLKRLPDRYYSPWEEIMKNLPGLISQKNLRYQVERLPLLSTFKLRSREEWQRAYVCLTFIANGYIWGGDRPIQTVPSSIAIPLFDVCKQLNTPPIATYTSLCLWNYGLSRPDQDTYLPDNLVSINTFTGAQDEEWFYLISVAIERRAAPTIPLMLRAISHAYTENIEGLTICLSEFTSHIEDLCQLLERMYERCDPNIFYNNIRRFFLGSKAMEQFGLNGKLYYDCRTAKRVRSFHGASNAQSPLIQFFDVVLGIDHSPMEPAKGLHGGYLQQSRLYMSGPHRRFIEDVAKIAVIKDYVQALPNIYDLQDAYCRCRNALRVLRDKHLQMAHRYIVVPSKQAISTESVISSLRGSGDTDFLPFLKQIRDETVLYQIPASDRSHDPVVQSSATFVADWIVQMPIETH
ncbi:Indoleamine 2,3-dioxygenase [Aspergillus granulosus]|uniref:Indoleamine 2,3-dioxygenase n=1 Tax=Aspergillus granulosus TaxID=176169 RepID=A0ABR4GU86_9EURO